MTTPLPELLSALGSTKAEIAGTLAREGVTGIINEPCDCAIAAYVSAHGFTKVSVAIDEGGYLVEHGEDVSHTIGVDGPIPDFIRAFDAGEFPELIRERVW
ncbi:MAG TPA: hypothetical protein VI172_04855 [Candidatus Dormibacteraeota bacterium]|jgi:hypothetical protein